MKHITYFQNFLSNEVDLNKTRLDRLNDSSSAVNTFMSSNLDAYEKTERQGSYGLKQSSNRSGHASTTLTCSYT